MIPQWWPAGRTVLIPKTKELGDEKNYRPITCLNTSYKLMTGLIGKYMRDHAMENDIWDEGQLGGVEGVLGTVDQLLMDVCIMEEVRSYHRNLVVAYYDKKVHVPNFWGVAGSEDFTCATLPTTPLDFQSKI